MNRIFTLVLLTISLIFNQSLSAQRVYVDNGTSTNYTLYSGDSLHINSGTYTGTISNWQNGAKISVASNATFQPNNFGYFLGSITVNGTALLSSLNGQSSSFRLINYGRTTITNDTYLGNGARIENNYGARLTFNGGVNINASTISNTGIISAAGSWYMGNGSVLTNNNIIEAAGNLEINGSQASNFGKLYSGERLTLNNGTFTNNCKTIADRGIAIYGTLVYNNGLLWASSAKNNSFITNGGNIISTLDGKIKSVNFENNGTISGSGYLYFTGETRHSSGAIGRSGNTGDSLRVYDLTRLNENTIFDYQWGTVHNNVKYRAFAAPDTIASYPSCGLAYSAASITLPVKWISFTVNVIGSIPAVNWTAEQENGTKFLVQRSYNGTDFTTINTIITQRGETVFTHQDKEVNSSASIVYYRIVAVEISGANEISSVKSVRLSSINGIRVQASPNPFTSQFALQFKSASREAVSVRVINMAGQQQLSKEVTTNQGYNSITITEAASLAKGLYLVQVSNANGIIATERIVKQ